jgi:hypothetical protein
MGLEFTGDQVMRPITKALLLGGFSLIIMVVALCTTGPQAQTLMFLFGMGTGSFLQSITTAPDQQDETSSRQDRKRAAQSPALCAMCETCPHRWANGSRETTAGEVETVNVR